MMYDYFYGSQSDQFAFYRIPKVLFTEERFKALSTDAKALYGILLDRMNLSARNGWIDKKGRVYIIFTTEEIMEAIDTVGTSDTRGNSPSYGTNYQKLGKELMTRDEIAVLDGSKCVLQLRGVRPFLSDKYDLTQHPNYKYTADFDKKYTFDIEKFLNHRMKLKASEEYEVVEADDVPEEAAESEADD